MVLVVGFVCVSAKAPEVIQQQVRTIELNTETDYASILNEFENSELKTDGSLTTFVGYQTLSADLFAEFDNVSENDIEEVEGMQIKYDFSYDNETNIVTLSAKMVNGDAIEIEEIYGSAFINDLGDIDAVMYFDGEYVLLSEMQDAGLIQNCGWFSSLFNKIFVAVVAVVTVAVVAAVIVSTAGAGLTAVIAAGAIAGSVTGGVAGGVISYTEYGKLDWRWIVGGLVIGGALGAAAGWGVGVASGATLTQTTQIKNLINAAEKGKLTFSNSIKNKSYFKKGSADYRAYYEQANTISKEIMKAKNPVVEKGTNYLKWTVEGANKSTKGVWELVINPTNKTIVHFLFRT